MAAWPLYVSVAADAVGYGGDEAIEQTAINRFTSRWGGWDPESLRRAAREADGDDWHFALHLLIASAAPSAREDMVAQLGSEDALRRWHAAEYLGILGDHRAIPILAQMLTEFLPSAPTYHVDSAMHDQSHFEDMRPAAAYLLGILNDPTYIFMLRRALVAVIDIERVQMQTPAADVPQDWRRTVTLESLQRYADTIVYSIGQLGGYGALTGIDMVGARNVEWPVHLIMGSLHGRFPLAQVVHFADQPLLATVVENKLAIVFGQTPFEVKESLTTYEASTLLYKVATRYEAEAEEHKRHVTT